MKEIKIPIKNAIKILYAIIFDEYCELFPNCNNSKIYEVIQYILNNPENNLKQKDIATELYINSSYLSTAFSGSDWYKVRGLSYNCQAKKSGMAFKRN